MGSFKSEVTMKSVLTAFYVIAFALSAFGQSRIDGKWQAQFVDQRSAAVLVVFDLKGDGKGVAGTVTSWRGSEQLHQIPIENGKIENDTVTFGTSYIVPFLYNRFGWRELVTRLRNWGRPTNTITGILKDDAISFSQHDWRGETTEFVAKKLR
jgi:hypothetical protein